MQAEIYKRKKLNGSHSGHGVFSSKIVCDQCGEFYGPRTFHSNSKYRRIAWQCKTDLENKYYNTLSNEYEEIKQKIENIDTKLKNKRAKLLSIENFLNEISEMENLIDTFDEKLFTSVVDKIIVKSYTQAATIFRMEEYK